MSYNKIVECGIQSEFGITPSSSILAVNSTRSRREDRFHPFSPKQYTLYRPHLDLSAKERSPEPPQVGSHISCLHPEILAIIFSYLDVRDKGIAAQVCSSWRDASYYKSVWKNVEAKLHLRRLNTVLINSLTCRGIKKVQILSLRKSFREIIQGIGHLTSLNLSGCYNVKDETLLHAFVQPIPTLLHLDLSICKQITDRSVVYLVRKCSNLETLDLGGCSNVTDIGLAAIALGLKRLTSLNLRSCWSVTDEGIRCIAGQTEESSTRYINLMKNMVLLQDRQHFIRSVAGQTEESSPRYLNLIKHMVLQDRPHIFRSINGQTEESSPGNLNLKHMGLQDCQHLSDDALKYISQGLTNVNSINLSFCINISDIGLRYLAKIASLRKLDLHSCDNISDAGLAFMAECASPITALDVSFCDKITDLSLDYISQGLFNLKCLNLRKCHISDDGILKVAKALSDLEILNMGQCTRISDKSLFAVIDSFKNLSCVDLYGCPKITSEIVAEICNRAPRCAFNFNLTICDSKKS